MLRLAPNVEVPESALTFTQVAGGGPGGQHANKTASRVDLRLNVLDLPVSDEVLERLADLAGERLTDDGELLLSCDETRSARRNKDLVIDRLRELVLAALVRPKTRRRTRRSRGSIERRLKDKRSRSDVLRERRLD